MDDLDKLCVVALVTRKGCAFAFGSRRRERPQILQVNFDERQSQPQFGARDFTARTLALDVCNCRYRDAYND